MAKKVVKKHAKSPVRKKKMTEHKSAPDASDKPVGVAPVKAEVKDEVDEQKAKIKKCEGDVKSCQEKLDKANQAVVDAHSKLNDAIKALVEAGGTFPVPPEPETK